MAQVRMDVRLRVFDPATDFPAAREIRNANFPDNPTSLERMRFQWDALDTERYYRERQVAVDPSTDRVVGVASMGHNPEMFHPDKYEVGLSVHPEVQRRGIGNRLWEWLVDRLTSRGAVLARTMVQEKHPHDVAFAERRGFVEKRRLWESILPVDTVDLATLAHRWERVRSQGIVLTTLAEELEREPASLDRLYTLVSAAVRHMPLPDLPTDVPFEMFRRWIMESPGRLPDAFFIARDGDRYAGVSWLAKSEEPETLLQALTATDPDYMGRGIAWALKLNTIEYAQTHGVRRIKTWNDSENQPMLSINIRLGFQRQPAAIVMERAFT